MNRLLTLVALVCSAFALAVSTAAGQDVLGDLDDSGGVDAIDVQLVINEALGIGTGFDCDVNCSGDVDAIDVQLVINAALTIPIGVEMPDLVGLTPTASEAALAEAGFAVDEFSGSFSDVVPAGRVMSQDPAAGTMAMTGCPVNLVISLGPALTPEMIWVPAGTFEMGNPLGPGDGDEQPVHEVTLSAYGIGKYEVTNAEYATALNWALAQGYIEAVSPNVRAYGQELLVFDFGGCQIRFADDHFEVVSRDGVSMADHAVVEVGWYGAAAYCNWLSEANDLEQCYDTSTWECDFSKDGYHLPTEAQWERAAAWDTAGGGRHWTYAFMSDTVDCSRANYDPNLVHCNPIGLSYYPFTSPVGYYDGRDGTVDSPSPVGCYDMTGNAMEWCHDWYERFYYATSPTNDPTGPSSGTYRVGRGGGWASPGVRTERRFHFTLDGLGLYKGFRVAR